MRDIKDHDEELSSAEMDSVLARVENVIASVEQLSEILNNNILFVTPDMLNKIYLDAYLQYCIKQSKDFDDIIKISHNFLNFAQQHIPNRIALLKVYDKK